MVWTSPYDPVDHDGPPLPELVRRAAARAPERPALVDGPTGTALPYAALVEQMDRVAAGLAARGFAPREVLAVWAPNSPTWATVALGCMAAGGAVTGVSPLATEPELAAQIADSGASVLVTVPPLAGAAGGARAREVVVIDEAAAGGALAAPPHPQRRPLRPSTPARLRSCPTRAGLPGCPRGSC